NRFTSNLEALIAPSLLDLFFKVFYIDSQDRQGPGPHAFKTTISEDMMIFRLETKKEVTSNVTSFFMSSVQLGRIFHLYDGKRHWYHRIQRFQIRRTCVQACPFGESLLLNPWVSN